MAKRKSGNIDIKDFETPQIIARFDAIRDTLLAELGSAQSDLSFTSKDLALLTGSLQQFQQDALGRNAPRPATGRHPIRIPSKLFKTSDLTRDSPLYHILQSAYQYRSMNGWRKFDLTTPSKREKNIEMISFIRDSLNDLKMLRNPVVYFEKNVDQQTQGTVAPLLQQLDANLTESASSATHIIHPADDNDEADDEWFRTLEKRNGKILVHWWYFPDSYESWIPETPGEQQDPEPPEEHQGAWHVSARWIKDSYKFNEWMNEEDYEINNPDEAANSNKAATNAMMSNSPSAKRALEREGSDASASKRLKVTLKNNEPIGATAVSLDEETQVSGLHGKKNEFEPIASGEISNISQSIPDASSNMDVDQNEDQAVKSEDVDKNKEDKEPVDPEVEKRRLEEEARKYLSEQTHEVIIPSYSAWFSMSEINDIERKSLPEFFNARNRSKTPSVYKDYRDFMINTYRLNPPEYLTVTACRRNLAGDVCAIMRVHAFLEQWGLINYQIDPETRPSGVGPPFTGHFRIIADTPRGLQPFQPGPTPIANENGTLSNGVTAGTAPSLDVNLELRKNIYQSSAGSAGKLPSDEPTESMGDSKKIFNCFTCGVDCTRVRYHSIKTKNFELCPNCYLEGRFPSTMSSGDFVKLEDSHFKHAQDEDWTDQETLLLLEGLEMFDEDWNQVAEHVGTRSREQCILHFLQLPIEDPYLGSSNADLGPLQYHRQPFSQADNPVMSVVAFLASVVNPGVAAAAAQSALSELTLTLKKGIKAEKTEAAEAAKPTQEGEKADKPDEEKTAEDKGTTESTTIKNEDTMEVDVAAPATNGASHEAPSEVARSAVEKAATIALGSAAAKAKTLATYEEREIQRLITTVVECQLKKLELKMTQFEQLETALDNEKRELEKQRQQLFLDRLQLKKNILNAQEQVRSLGAQPNLSSQAQQALLASLGGVTMTGDKQALADPQEQQAQQAASNDIRPDENATIFQMG